MKLLTADLRKKLLANGKESGNHAPVVKFFTPDANATWLLSELDPLNPDIAFGLCDLGIGCPELGYVSLTEIASIRGKMRLPVERDMHFSSNRLLSEWADAARNYGSVARATPGMRDL